MSGTTKPSVCLLTIALLGTVLAIEAPIPILWNWDQWTQLPGTYDRQSPTTNMLNSNNGEHALGMGQYYDQGTYTWKNWWSLLSERANVGMYAYEYNDIGRPGRDRGWTWSQAWTPFAQDVGYSDKDLTRGQAIISPNFKLWCSIFQVSGGIGGGIPATGLYDQPIDEHTGGSWSSPAQNANDHNEPKMAAFAVAGDYVHLVHTIHYERSNYDSGFALLSKYSTNQGGNWTGRSRVTDWDGDVYRNPSLAIDGSGRLHLAFNVLGGGLKYGYSDDRGQNWTWVSAAGAPGTPSEPCVAASGGYVFVCYQSDGSIYYRFSNDYGDHWTPGLNETPWAVPFATPGSWTYDLPNVKVIGGAVLLVARVKADNQCSIRGMFGTIYNPTPNNLDMFWVDQPAITVYQAVTGDDPLNPFIDGFRITHGDNKYINACYVASVPYPTGEGRYLVRRGVYYGPTWRKVPSLDATAVNTARLLALDSQDAVQYAASQWPHYEAGRVVDKFPFHYEAGMGVTPALALDGDGYRWVTFMWQDSLFCQLPGEYAPRLVFGGDSTLFPGQPSIVCYPNQANGSYVSAVTFAVYDTSAGTSQILFARVCTSEVVLDTIASAQNLGDSLPCINVYGDTLLVTWQHGTDSVLASMLCDYGPGTSGQPPAWTSPNLVTANGYHAMSRFDDNGTVLNVIWARNSGSNYAVQRATCDLATTAFGNWSTMATPGDTGTAEKANPVYAGLGVSCWQEMDDGKWVIKGFVRGEEETFVANDTDAYHPHAVAESSAISPSIDQVRVHLLYTAGVTFEVDSGVLDTGDVRFVTCSLNVSHATSDATKYNSGSKFLRKASDDSLFAVYSDLDNAVMFAWSATGDTWQRAVVVSGREYPAIAEDSSGRRWVVVTKPLGVGNSAIEAYYRSGSSWVGPQTLYTNAVVALGPASLAGASYTQSGIGYAAFLNTSGMTKSVILAKFDGTNVSTYTVATGASLGDPAVTVEPYKADSDHVHVTWTESGVLRYRMDTDGRSSNIANNWTSTYDLTGGGVTAQHPSINSDADQIVVAWAQGSPADVYARKRSTDSAYNNWQTAVNLSNTSQNASDYPTIAMGDTVVVAWQELRTGGGDFDILVSVDFGDTLNIADNATISTYPHILFQNKVSGDTAIPYLHTVWSEAAEYYEVGYNKLNLKEAEGEGQQAANLVPIPARPMLEACRPNPFKSHTQISYALPTAGNVSLRVYDITGRTVRTLASGRQKAGFYSVSWDARDSHGRQVPYGVYFYRLDTPGFRSVKKAVVTR